MGLLLGVEVMAGWSIEVKLLEVVSGELSLCPSLCRSNGPSPARSGRICSELSSGSPRLYSLGIELKEYSGSGGVSGSRCERVLGRRKGVEVIGWSCPNCFGLAPPPGPKGAVVFP